MKKLDAAVSKIEELIATIGLGAMSIITIVAVFFRYVLHSPITWSEEAARYLMIWSTLLGISIATKQKAHLGIDIFVSMAPKKIQRILEIFSWSMLIVMYLFLVWTSILFILTAIKTGNVTPMLRIPFYIIYLALPIGFGLSAIRGLQVLIAIIKGVEEKSEEVLI